MPKTLSRSRDTLTTLIYEMSIAADAAHTTQFGLKTITKRNLLIVNLYRDMFVSSKN